MRVFVFWLPQKKNEKPFFSRVSFSKKIRAKKKIAVRFSFFFCGNTRILHFGFWRKKKRWRRNRRQNLAPRILRGVV